MGSSQTESGGEARSDPNLLNGIIPSYNTSVSDLKNSLSLGLLSERRKFRSLQIFHKSVHNNIALPIPPYYLLSTRDLLGKREITPRLHLFNHLYIMITISIVFSFENHKGLELFITCN